MPYIITTLPERPQYGFAGYPQRAIAAPDEVRDYVHSLGANYDAMAHLDCVLDGTSRLPVGPLSDGTVIEVRFADYADLLDGAGMKSSDIPASPRIHINERRRRILDAFNARKA